MPISYLSVSECHSRHDAGDANYWRIWLSIDKLMPLSYLLRIQATLAPPVENKMFKGLLVCYTVVVTTFFSVAISGYWAFGNQVAGYVLTNLAPTDGPALVPSWLILLANGFALAQLTAVALVSSSISASGSRPCKVVAVPK